MRYNADALQVFGWTHRNEHRWQAPSARNQQLMARAKALVATNLQLRRENRELRLDLARTQRASKFLPPTLDNREDGRSRGGSRSSDNGVSQGNGRPGKTRPA